MDHALVNRGVNMLLKTRIGIGAAASALMVCVLAHADNAPLVERPSRSTTVNYQDLDLRRSGDVARLYRRLSAAADQVCGSRAFNIFYYTLPKYRACVDDAMQKAVLDINQPALTVYHQQQTHSAILLVAQ